MSTDFATIRIAYIPADKCVELKSLKLYLWSFRDEGHYFEQVTNLILDDLVRALRFIVATPTFTGDVLIVDSGEHLSGRPRDIAFDTKKKK